jgi:hypothetical protein
VNGENKSERIAETPFVEVQTVPSPKKRHDEVIFVRSASQTAQPKSAYARASALFEPSEESERSEVSRSEGERRCRASEASTQRGVDQYRYARVRGRACARCKTKTMRLDESETILLAVVRSAPGMYRREATSEFWRQHQAAELHSTGAEFARAAKALERACLISVEGRGSGTRFFFVSWV